MSDITRRLWDRFGSLTLDELPSDVIRVAHHSWLDWFGCAIAGSTEPLAEILRAEFVVGEGPCSIIGSAETADAPRAALINGAAGHALDFDDTSTVMGGHPTVPLLPAVLALAEEQGRSGADALLAYVAGMEVAGRIGTAIGPEHYNKGWHQTSTIGVFASAAAAAYLLDLDEEAFGNAIAIAASSASGLKANFGTMTKPLHAGQAAERGLLAARLASRGFTGNSDVLDGNQGLAQAAGNGSLDMERFNSYDGGWATPRTLFKFHAACHLTHAGIEATRSVIEANQLAADDVQSVVLTVNPHIVDVCGIPDPATGLEAKFSLRATQAFAVHGVDTMSIATYEDGPVNRPEIRAFIDRVSIEFDPDLHAMHSRVLLATSSGKHQAEWNVSVPSADLDAQGEKLLNKFMGLAGPVIGRPEALTLADKLRDLGTVVDVAELIRP